MRAGFSNKRKQLWRNLTTVFQSEINQFTNKKIDGFIIKKILKEVLRNEKIRAEELSVKDWFKIVNKIKQV